MLFLRQPPHPSCSLKFFLILARLLSLSRQRRVVRELACLSVRRRPPQGINPALATATLSALLMKLECLMPPAHDAYPFITDFSKSPEAALRDGVKAACGEGTEVGGCFLSGFAASELQVSLLRGQQLKSVPGTARTMADRPGILLDGSSGKRYLGAGSHDSFLWRDVLVALNRREFMELGMCWKCIDVASHSGLSWAAPATRFALYHVGGRVPVQKAHS
jgi:hypothetical protein